MKKNPIYNKLKGLALVTLLSPVSALFFTSCGDFLEIEPQDKIVLEKFWNEKADVDNVLVGCYSALQTENVISRMMMWGEFRSDNCEKGLNTQDNVNLQRVLNENIDASNGYTSWNEFYGVINRCNTVLLYAPQVAAKDPAYTEGELRATIAEAKAIRALCYFYLIRTFRDVPFVTEAYTDDGQEMAIEATPFATVLDALIADLEEVKDDAVRRYPSTKALYQTGRITQQAIWAMLCEMYLWKQDYQNCVKYADMIIDAKTDYYKEKYAGRILDKDGRLNGFPLELSQSQYRDYEFGNDYDRLFVRTNYAENMESGNSDEIIFELVFVNNAGYHRNLAVNNFFGNGRVPQGTVAPAGYLGYDKSASENVFSNLDVRYYENIVAMGDKNFRVNKFVNQLVSVDVSDASNPKALQTGMYPEKENTANWIIYRLTDIMLLKAEALTEMGTDGSDELKEAFKLVQAVNNRALCESKLTKSLSAGAYTTKVKMQQLVLDERQRELMFEGKRWYDLVRRSMRDGNTNKLVECMGNKTLDNASVALHRLRKMDAMYWPYNLEEMRVNTKLVQNPAFGSGENGSFATN